MIRGHRQSPILELFPSPSSPSSHSSEPILESSTRRRRPAYEHPAISPKTPQLALDSRKEWRQIQETMPPLIIVNPRPQTTRPPRRPPAPPASLTVTTPLPDHRLSPARMITTGRGLRARTSTILPTQGAKTSITRRRLPRHLTSLLSCLRPLHPQCPAPRALRTPPPTVWPLPTPNVETVHPPTALPTRIPPILPPVVGLQVSHTPQRATSQRQSLDFQSLTSDLHFPIP